MKTNLIALALMACAGSAFGWGTAAQYDADHFYLAPQGAAASNLAAAAYIAADDASQTAADAQEAAGVALMAATNRPTERVETVIHAADADGVYTADVSRAWTWAFTATNGIATNRTLTVRLPAPATGTTARLCVSLVATQRYEIGTLAYVTNRSMEITVSANGSDPLIDEGIYTNGPPKGGHSPAWYSANWDGEGAGWCVYFYADALGATNFTIGTSGSNDFTKAPDDPPNPWNPAGEYVGGSGGSPTVVNGTLVETVETNGAPGVAQVWQIEWAGSVTAPAGESLYALPTATNATVRALVDFQWDGGRWVQRQVTVTP